MTRLLVHAGEAAPDAPVARTGGVPLAPAGFTWPTAADVAGGAGYVFACPTHETAAFLWQQ